MTIGSHVLSIKRSIVLNNRINDNNSKEKKMTSPKFKKHKLYRREKNKNNLFLRGPTSPPPASCMQILYVAQHTSIHHTSPAFHSLCFHFPQPDHPPPPPPPQIFPPCSITSLHFIPPLQRKEWNALQCVQCKCNKTKECWTSKAETVCAHKNAWISLVGCQQLPTSYWPSCCS